MRIVLITILVLILFIISSCTKLPISQDMKQPKQVCENNGGIWKAFYNTCRDNCQIPLIGSSCKQISTEGCDCGEGSCWDGFRCLPGEGDEIKKCSDAGGKWKISSDSCANRCSGRGFPPEVCAQVLTASCDCGVNKCWDGNICKGFELLKD